MAPSNRSSLKRAVVKKARRSRVFRWIFSSMIVVGLLAAIGFAGFLAWLIHDRSHAIATAVKWGELALVGLTYALKDGRATIVEVIGDIGDAC